MTIDLMSIIIALAIAGVCILLCSLGVGVILVAWGSFVAWGLPVSVVVTVLYLSWHPIPFNWPWRRA